MARSAASFVNRFLMNCGSHSVRSAAVAAVAALLPMQAVASDYLYPQDASYVCSAPDLDGPLPKYNRTYRFASFNAFLNRGSDGGLQADLASADDQLGEGESDTQTNAVAEIIQRVRPDVILLNEFDYDDAGAAIALFQENFLGVSQNGQQPIHYPYIFNAPSNTGVDSGNRSGQQRLARRPG